MAEFVDKWKGNMFSHRLLESHDQWLDFGIEWWANERVCFSEHHFIHLQTLRIDHPDRAEKYYIFGKDGVKNLSEDFDIAFLGEIPIIQSLRESGDVGRPGVLQEGSELTKIFNEISKKIIINLTERNKNLPPTEILKIKTMAGCSS